MFIILYYNILLYIILCNVSAGPTSNILMKVSLDLVEHNECNHSYAFNTGKNLALGISPDSHICAGQMKGGKDTCQVRKMKNFDMQLLTQKFLKCGPFI